MSLRPDPTIRVFMTGLLAVTVDRSGDAPAFRAGMNLSSPGGERAQYRDHHAKHSLKHTLGITIMPRVNPPKIAFPIYIDSPVDKISLKVADPDYPGIRLYPDETLEGGPVHPHDIRWGVILDGQGCHNHPLDVQPGAFSTQMTIDNGELYTADKFCALRVPP